jgi:hypothetical protein
MARCTAVVPQDWGEYVDTNSYGAAFRDANGTLRFVNKFPCGLEGARRWRWKSAESSRRFTGFACASSGGPQAAAASLR